MQKVEMYYDMVTAKHAMEKWIKDGWRVHICTMGAYMAGYSSKEKILVIYEM